VTESPRRVRTTARVAVFRNVSGRMRRLQVPAGTVLSVTDRPAPSWSTAHLNTGAEYLIAAPVVRDYTEPVEEATPEQRRNYAAGYRTGQTSAGLDRADADGRSGRPGWMDGYLDAAAGRPRRTS
jgi:hypothetical protein